MVNGILKQHGLLIAVSVAILAMLTFVLSVKTDVTSQTVTLPSVKNCQLQTTACETNLPFDGELVFEISPKNPKPIQTLDLKATFKNINPESVTIKFNGKNMNMGFIQYQLKSKPTLNGLTEFTGKGGFSVCIIGKMEWIVIVSFLLDNTIYEVPFEMETYYNGG